MRALIQRVSEAHVTVGDEVTGKIGPGLCVLIGVTHDDTQAQVDKMAGKLWNLRIFSDEAGQMNKSCADLDYEILLISQFTLYGDASKGRHPAFVQAATPEVAEPLIENLVGALRSQGAKVETGRFRADMNVSLVNQGPVTLMIEV